MDSAAHLPEIRFAPGAPNPDVASIANVASAPELLPVGLQHGDAG